MMHLVWHTAELGAQAVALAGAAVGVLHAHALALLAVGVIEFDTLARGAHALRLVAVALLAVLHALARRLHAPALEAVALGRVLHALVRVALAHMLVLDTFTVRRAVVVHAGTVLVEAGAEVCLRYALLLPVVANALLADALALVRVVIVVLEVVNLEAVVGLLVLGAHRLAADAVLAPPVARACLFHARLAPLVTVLLELDALVFIPEALGVGAVAGRAAILDAYHIRALTGGAVHEVQALQQLARGCRCQDGGHRQRAKQRVTPHIAEGGGQRLRTLKWKH
mmetsp:Transcript_36431/g.94585  ORF Transcript_36431/g.94585 Transcript_36431/m.94585 type:complete len:283 (-) Transcript_36431:90-938(-)